jgi:hypothetical protein
VHRGDGRPERDPSSDLHPYWLTTFAFAESLVVSHVAWASAAWSAAADA